MNRCVCFGPKGWSGSFVSRTTNLPRNFRLFNSRSEGGALIIRSNRLKLFEYFYDVGEGGVKRPFSTFVRHNRFKILPRNNTNATTTVRFINSASMASKNIKIKPLKKSDISRLLTLAKSERWTLLGKP